MEGARFLADLFDGAPGSFYYCSLHPAGDLAGHGLLPDLASMDAGAWRAVVQRAGEESAARRNCYFAACTHALRVDANGLPAEDRRKGTSVAFVTLFANVDCGTEATAAMAEKMIATGHVSHIVEHGRGLQVYAALAAPVRTTSENRSELEATNYAFASWMNQLAHGEDRRPDRYELASLMRLPATVGLPSAKETAGRVPVPARVRWRSDHRFAIDDFAGLRGRFPIPASSAAGSARERVTRITNLPPDLEARVMRDPGCSPAGPAARRSRVCTRRRRRSPTGSCAPIRATRTRSGSRSCRRSSAPTGGRSPWRRYGPSWQRRGPEPARAGAAAARAGERR